MTKALNYDVLKGTTINTVTSSVSIDASKTKAVKETATETVKEIVKETAIKKNKLSEYIDNLSKKNVLISNEENLDNINKYCQKCYQKKKSLEIISKIDIFNKINNIIFNSFSMPDVYNKMDNLYQIIQ